MARRAELRDGYRDSLRRLATALIDASRAGEAISAARELVRTDPVDEVAHRLLIEAHERRLGGGVRRRPLLREVDLHSVEVAARP
ncbi:MAG: hypothetical protein M3508_08800, partial [Actinomycetota bacterium]|nr:hypothetical protein [Actinomycetota bacterium]